MPARTQARMSKALPAAILLAIAMSSRMAMAAEPAPPPSASVAPIAIQPAIVAASKPITVTETSRSTLLVEAGKTIPIVDAGFPAPAIETNKPISATVPSRPTPVAEASKPSPTAETSKLILAAVASRPTQVAEASQSSPVTETSKSAPVAEIGKLILAAVASRPIPVAEASKSSQVTETSKPAPVAEIGKLIPAAVASRPTPVVEAGKPGNAAVTGKVSPVAEVGKPISVAETIKPIPVPAPAPDLWQRIRDGLRMSESDDPLVATHEAAFTRRAEELKRTLDRSRPFMFHIVEEVAKRDMPMELALLPIIESSFNPQALSPAQAAGIWQFIPSTGRVYGLDQNHWYDGRRDIVAATKAALDYLQYLNKMFGDWELALAAYNCGEGCVGRAVAKNRRQGLETDFTALSLPAETRHYVPKLLAVRNILREPERYGLDMETLANEPYFQIVTLPRPLEARAAAKLAGMNLDDFLDLNPGFRRKVIYTDTPSKLLIPINKVAVFNRNLDRDAGEMNWLRKYLAQKGESLLQIAERFDVSLSWLRETNPVQTGRKGQLKTATAMLVPATPAARPAPSVVAQAEENVKTAARATKPAGRTAKSNARRIHTVRKGDTLFALAERYNVAVADIKALNGALKVLRPGAKLRIPNANG